ESGRCRATATPPSPVAATRRVVTRRYVDGIARAGGGPPGRGGSARVRRLRQGATAPPGCGGSARVRRLRPGAARGYPEGSRKLLRRLETERGRSTRYARTAVSRNSAARSAALRSFVNSWQARHRSA